MREFNGAMLQAFHWYTAADGTLWRRLEEEAPALAAAGITSLWLPPAYKGAGGGLDAGYGAYDLFDLGEFDQKGSVRTKYGTRDEYLRAIHAAHDAGMQVYADVVMSHKMGGDEEEEFQATPYDPNDRTRPIGELRPIKAWTHFTFPGRGERYSTLKWHWWHFNAVDADANDPDAHAIYLFEGKHFHEDVDLEKGNYDYLMGCNLDLDNPDVRTELFHWGEWYVKTTGVDGFRFDAAKHVKAGFFAEWLGHVRRASKRELFAVGEYWSPERGAHEHFLEKTGGEVMLFDVGLQHAFAAASRAGNDYDLRALFDGSLVGHNPDAAVTLVANHDTQPLQALESVVEPWFTPLAYALILLRRGGYPCIFAADYYGAEYSDFGRDGNEHHVVIPSHRWMIDRFLAARRTNAYGDQVDYFDHANCIGWTRRGSDEHPGGLAVLLSNGEEGLKAMQVLPDTTYVDLTEHVDHEVRTDGEGWAEFRCPAGSVSVWVPVAAPTPNR